MILKNTNFEKMDKLSLAREPFFFFVDFEGENVEIFDENELEEKGILVEFQDFKTHHKGDILDKEIFWEFFPESMDVYQQGFEIVQKNIHLGNSYLVNYTSETLINTNRSLEEIFYLSKAKYKVFYPNKFVFFSPETFIKINNQKIFTYPMKGTIDAEIPNAENILRESKKEKAEHYTVVDLLRNDLSMVADNVQVAQFQKIDYLKTKQKNLLAMSSEITGEVKQEFQNRIGSMMETRPDWCISRQRVWGVPIPIFYNDETNEEIFHKEILDRICGLVREHGSNIWVEKTPEELIGEELLVKYNLKGLKLRKETNIMDVWFDSGSSHRGVLEVWEGLHRPCDLYLEGSDQHRGWFHTSLLTSVASTGDSPYKSVLTHGFVNDSEGKKMSKSLGNTVAPSDVIKVYGADILRLWCGSVDYRDDVRISDNIIKQMSEAYRRIRNTARYILGNSYDFNPKTDKVAYKDMLEIDKWALNKLEVLKRNVTESYDKYEFYNLFQGIHYFAAIDMSAFYLDIIKDRLYTEKKDSVARRAAQTVMYEILMTLTKMVAPILSFTAEEIWENLPAEAREAESVFLADWYVNNDEYLNPELDEKWQQIIKLRKEVNKKLEKARQGENKIIGNSLDAKVSLYTEDDALKEFIKENLELLETVFIVSDIEVADSSDDNFTAAEEIENLKADNLLQIVSLLGAKGLKDNKDLYQTVIDNGYCTSISELNINGKDLMDAGIPKGALIGSTLERLLELVIEKPELNTRESLLLEVRGNEE